MSIERIKIQLPPPTTCNVCGSDNIVFGTNDLLYGRIYGVWPYVYFCGQCRASVGCHPDTHIPLGMMADKETRFLRSKLHGCFDKLWQTGFKKRDAAYAWLAEQLGIESDLCHVSWLSKEQLCKSIDVVKQCLVDNEKVIQRRRAKQHARRLKTADKLRKSVAKRKHGQYTTD